MEMDLQPDLGFDSPEEICRVNVAIYAIRSETLPAGHFWSGESGIGLVVAVLRPELLLKENIRCPLSLFFLKVICILVSISEKSPLTISNLDKNRHINRKASSEPVSNHSDFSSRLNS